VTVPLARWQTTQDRSVKDISVGFPTASAGIPFVSFGMVGAEIQTALFGGQQNSEAAGRIIYLM
jgi:hypothetical protein